MRAFIANLLALKSPVELSLATLGWIARARRSSAICPRRRIAPVAGTARTVDGIDRRRRASDPLSAKPLNPLPCAVNRHETCFVILHSQE